MHVCTYLYTYTYIYNCIFTDAYTYIHTYIHTNIYIYIQKTTSWGPAFLYARVNDSVWFRAILVRTYLCCRTLRRVLYKSRLRRLMDRHSPVSKLNIGATPKASLWSRKEYRKTRAPMTLCTLYTYIYNMHIQTHTHTHDANGETQ